MNINPWRSTSVRTALQGHSFIDTKRIHIHSDAEAHDFLLCYGFDLTDENDTQELENLRLEALELIQEELLNSDESIPTVLLHEQDVKKYLLYASGVGGRGLGQWCGAILRVIHTLTHSHSYLNDIYYDDIREQIFSQFDGHLINETDNCALGHIPLSDIQFRTGKSRRSVAMKLMHKAENVSADIFDWIGFRFITRYRSDVLDILAYLRLNHIVTFANLKPSRSRNSLIDVDWINKCFNKGMSIDEIRTAMQDMDYPCSEKRTVDNQFSEVSYHSVQITCRQRIKIAQPNGKNLCFYFPFEIQMMDHHSYLKTREGLASHAEYKKRQRSLVRKRILPFLKV